MSHRAPSCANRVRCGTTGFEGGGVCRHDDSSAGGLKLADTMLLGTQAAGASARCLAALPQDSSGSPQWLLVSGGAREVQAVWALSHHPPPSASPERSVATAALEAQWLATRAPAAGLRPKRNAHFSSTQAQLRTLALVAVSAPGTSAACGVLEAPSGGGVRLSRFSVATCSWAPAAVLVHHRFVVLSLAAVASGGRVMAASGGSDGSIAIWDLTETLTNAAPLARSDGSDAEPERMLRPILALEQHHQSGVNTMQMLAVDGLLWVVSGGDDQQLRVTLLRCAAPAAWAVADSVDVPCAHSSALKGLCLRAAPAARAGAPVLQCCSVGWDQYVRVWQMCLHESAWGGGRPTGRSGSRGGRACVRGRAVEVREVLQHAVDVSEPACVAGCTADCGRWHVFVSGRGSQMLSLDVPLVGGSVT